MLSFYYRNHPSYAPTIFPTNHVEPPSTPEKQRHVRAMQRRLQKFKKSPQTLTQGNSETFNCLQVKMKSDEKIIFTKNLKLQ